MKRMLLLVASLWLGASFAEDLDLDVEPLIRRGDTVVMIGDSITEQGARYPWGFYHLLTNAVPQVNFVPLGFSGYQVKSWSDMERDSLTNTNRWTWYRNPGWNLKTVFDGKVDVVMIFLGMNDLLQPSLHDDETEITHWMADYAAFVLNLQRRCHPRKFLFASITPLTADAGSPKNALRKRLNNRIFQLAELCNAGVIDFGSAIEEAQAVLTTARADYRLVPDFVHPRELGHRYLAQRFCEATGLLEEANAFAESLEEKEDEVLREKVGALNLVVRPLRLTRVTDEEVGYRLDYSLLHEEAGFAEVKLVLPEGWTADRPLIVADRASFFVRGKPTKVRTTIVAEAKLPSGTIRATVDVPAPWRVREDGGPWLFYSPSIDYTGGDAPGSIDPYQVSFGWKSNTFVAARRVWSEKAREVKAVLSHQGFSETLDLTVKLEGATVWSDKLDRKGRNRIEKTLSLKEGWNALEITCVHHDWQRQFAFDLEPLAGDDLSALKYDLK